MNVTIGGLRPDTVYFFKIAAKTENFGPYSERKSERTDKLGEFIKNGKHALSAKPNKDMSFDYLPLPSASTIDLMPHNKTELIRAVFSH